MRVGHALDGVHHGMTMVRVGCGEGASNPTFLAGRERNAQAGMGFWWVQVFWVGVWVGFQAGMLHATIRMQVST